MTPAGVFTLITPDHPDGLVDSSGRRLGGARPDGTVAARPPRSGFEWEASQAPDHGVAVRHPFGFLPAGRDHGVGGHQHIDVPVGAMARVPNVVKRQALLIPQQLWPSSCPKVRKSSWSILLHTEQLA